MRNTIFIINYVIIMCLMFTSVWTARNGNQRHRNKYNTNDNDGGDVNISNNGNGNEGVAGSDDPDHDNNLSLWLNEQQVKRFSGYLLKIFAIEHGTISPYLTDPNFSQYMPIIPSEVSCVNFTWHSGRKKYYYNFDRLQTSDEKILKIPTISIKLKGKIPKESKEFSVKLQCTGNVTGIAMFSIGLSIQTGKRVPVPGTPLRLSFKKECTHNSIYMTNSSFSTFASIAPGQSGNGLFVSQDPECDKKCANNGWCNQDKICQCTDGYMGPNCETAFCFPNCMHGGVCAAPATCSCPIGYQGSHCEGGICAEKCLNGGKCIQKDKCKCKKGYYGPRCEISKCVIECMNGGTCIGYNVCKCIPGFYGTHCEIGRHQRSVCKKTCKHHKCLDKRTCKCFPVSASTPTSSGTRFCNQKRLSDKKQRRKKKKSKLDEIK